MDKERLLKTELIGLGLFKLVSFQFCVLYAAYILSNILDHEFSFDFLIALLAKLLLLLVCYGINTFLCIWQESKSYAFQKKKRLDLLSYEMEKEADVISFGEYTEKILKDIAAIAERYSQTLPTLIINGVFIIIEIYLVYQYSGIMVLFTVFSSILYLVLPAVFGSRFRMNYAKILNLETKLTNYFCETIMGHAIFQFYGAEYVQTKLKDLLNEYSERGTESEALAQISNAVNDFLKYFLKFGTILCGFILIAYSKLTLSSFLGVNIIVNNCFALIDAFSKSILSFLKQQESMTRLGVKRNPDDQKAAAYEESYIELKDISLVREDKVILKNIHLQIKKGEHVLIYGKNGSGKSSIIRILTGETRDFNGTVSFSKEYSGLAPNEFLAYVPQYIPVLEFSGTDFLALMKKKVDLDMSQFYLFYSLLRGKEDHLNAPMSKLSSGERKKIILAAEFAKGKKCLVLDEPTNYLDQEAILALPDILDRLSCTVILISHDLMFDKYCDKKYEIIDGEIYERG